MIETWSTCFRNRQVRQTHSPQASQFAEPWLVCAQRRVETMHNPLTNYMTTPLLENNSASRPSTSH